MAKNVLSRLDGVPPLSYTAGEKRVPITGDQFSALVMTGEAVDTSGQPVRAEDGPFEVVPDSGVSRFTRRIINRGGPGDGTGPGSGHHDHAGRPGKRGGSAPSGKKPAVLGDVKYLGKKTLTVGVADNYTEPEDQRHLQAFAQAFRESGESWGYFEEAYAYAQAIYEHAMNGKLVDEEIEKKSMTPEEALVYLRDIADENLAYRSTDPHQFIKPFEEDDFFALTPEGQEHVLFVNALQDAMGGDDIFGYDTPDVHFFQQFRPGGPLAPEPGFDLESEKSKVISRVVAELEVESDILNDEKEPTYAMRDGVNIMVGYNEGGTVVAVANYEYQNFHLDPYMAVDHANNWAMQNDVRDWEPSNEDYAGKYLYVDFATARFRGKGYGTQIFMDLVHEAATNDAGIYWLSSKGAESFYDKLGAIQVGAAVHDGVMFRQYGWTREQAKEIDRWILETGGLEEKSMRAKFIGAWWDWDEDEPTALAGSLPEDVTVSRMRRIIERAGSNFRRLTGAQGWYSEGEMTTTKDIREEDDAPVARSTRRIIKRGGKGSGHFGHAGRPGIGEGGSTPGWGGHGGLDQLKAHGGYAVRVFKETGGYRGTIVRKKDKREFGSYRSIDKADVLAELNQTALKILAREVYDRVSPPVERSTRRIIKRGGAGSGHHGHEGRPGKRGGSLPSDGAGGGDAPKSDTQDSGGGIAKITEEKDVTEEQFEAASRFHGDGTATAMTYEDHVKEADDLMAALPEDVRQRIMDIEQRVRAAYEEGDTTYNAYFDAETGEWDEERAALHDEIVEKMLGDKPASENPEVIFSGGLPGSGKTTVLKKTGVNLDDWVMIDSDKIKAMLPDYEGWNASLTHDEASVIVGRVIEGAIERGNNIIYDSTLKTYESAQDMLRSFQNNGYSTHLVFVDIPLRTAMERALSRFERSGRYVSPYYIATHDSKNRGTLERMKTEVDSWELWDNSVEGRAPELLGEG